MLGKPFGLTVKAIIHDETGKMLLLRRAASNRSFVGCWEWPGGYVEPDEKFDDALLREVHEEAGLEVDITGLAGSFEFEVPQARVIALCMHAQAAEMEVRLSEEHDDFAWVSLDDFNNYELSAAHAEFMEHYVSRKGVSH